MNEIYQSVLWCGVGYFELSETEFLVGAEFVIRVLLPGAEAGFLVLGLLKFYLVLQHWLYVRYLRSPTVKNT